LSSAFFHPIQAVKVLAYSPSRLDRISALTRPLLLLFLRLAYRNRFAFVTTPPYTPGLSAWWMKASEKAQ